jgi:predicted transcriptional regulator
MDRLSKKYKKFSRWNLSELQIELLSLLSIYKDIGIKTRRAFNIYLDESNFNKAIKSLMNKNLIDRRKGKTYLTKKGKMFLKIIRN